jgi:integrase
MQFADRTSLSQTDRTLIASASPCIYLGAWNRPPKWILALPSFPSYRTLDDAVIPSTNHLHRNAVAPKIKGERRALFPGDFVLHSLRHTMLTRLGESGVDDFTIMRIAGHRSIVVSQRYIPSDS